MGSPLQRVLRHLQWQQRRQLPEQLPAPAAAGATSGATAAVAAAGVAGAASSVVLMPLGIGAACCAAVAAATAAILAAQGEVKEPEPEIGVTDEVLGSGCQGTVVVGNFGHTKVAVKRSLCKEQLATEAHFLFLSQSHFVVKLLHCEPGLLALEFCLPLPVGKQVNVKNLLAGLFSGLAHVHSLSVAHRDIKMENILQAPRGALKLADFGCASKGANGRFFETAGSFKCWAPEMIELADRAIAALPQMCGLLARCPMSWSVASTHSGEGQAEASASAWWRPTSWQALWPVIRIWTDHVKETLCWLFCDRIQTRGCHPPWQLRWLAACLSIFLHESDVGLSQGA